MYLRLVFFVLDWFAISNPNPLEDESVEVYDADVMDDEDCENGEPAGWLTLDPTKEREFHYQNREIEKAKYHMDRFFTNYSLHTGGKIPKAFLYNQRRMYMIMNYDIMRGVTHAYKQLEVEFGTSIKSVAEITQDIRLVLDVLSLLSRSGVPQEYAGGMLCVYLELVEGVAF